MEDRRLHVPKPSEERNSNRDRDPNEVADAGGRKLATSKRKRSAEAIHRKPAWADQDLRSTGIHHVQYGTVVMACNDGTTVRGFHPQPHVDHTASAWRINCDTNATATHAQPKLFGSATMTTKSEGKESSGLLREEKGLLMQLPWKSQSWV